MVADGVAETAYAHHAVVNLDGLSCPVGRNGEADSLSRGTCRHRVLIAFALGDAYALGRLLIVEEGIEVMDACELACGMIESCVLHLDGIAGLHLRHGFAANGNVAMARLGSHHLIDALSICASEADDVATFGEAQGVAAVGIGCDAFRREACVGSHFLADNGAGKCDRSDAFGREGVVEACFRVEIIEHIELCINILHRELGVDWGTAAPRSYGCQVVLIYDNVRSDACGLFANGYDEGSRVLGPDGTPVVAANEIARSGAAVVVIEVDGVVGDKHNGCSFAYCRQQFVLNLHDGIVCLAVQVDDGEVEVRLDEVVSSDVVGKLPVTHGQDVVGVAHAVELQVACCVDVEEEVAHIIATVGGHVVIDGLGATRFHVGIGEGKRRALCLVAAHGEDAGLCQLAFLHDAIVIDLLVGKDVVIDRSFVGNAFRHYLLELHEVSRLGANGEGCPCRNRDAVGVAHRSLGIDGRIEVDGARVACRQVAFCLAVGRRNDVEVVCVAVEHEEHLVPIRVLAHRGVHYVALPISDFEVEGVVRAIRPTAVPYVHFGGVDGEGGVVGIDVELDGAAHCATVACGGSQQVGTVEGIKGIFVAGRFAHLDSLVSRHIDEALDELRLGIHRDCNRLGKLEANLDVVQRHIAWRVESIVALQVTAARDVGAKGLHLAKRREVHAGPVCHEVTAVGQQERHLAGCAVLVCSLKVNNELARVGSCWCKAVAVGEGVEHIGCVDDIYRLDDTCLAVGEVERRAIREGRIALQVLGVEHNDELIVALCQRDAQLAGVVGLAEVCLIVVRNGRTATPECLAHSAVLESVPDEFCVALVVPHVGACPVAIK